MESSILKFSILQLIVLESVVLSISEPIMELMEKLSLIEFKIG